MFDATFSVFNWMLMNAGLISKRILWLGDGTMAMGCLIAVNVWRGMPFFAITLLAGLQTVNPDLHEAAEIDGANAWQRFLHVTLPLLRPVILFVSVTTIIGYLQFFEEPFVMTHGGPLDRTLSVAFYIYNQFGFGNYSYAAAMSYVLFVTILVLTLAQFRLLRSKT